MRKIMILICLLIPSASFADLEHKSSLKLVKPNMKVFDNSIVSQPGVTQDRSVDKNKLFRCWQDGQLILAELNWNHMHEAGLFVMSKGEQKMKAYEFGNTFCLYIGG